MKDEKKNKVLLKLQDDIFIHNAEAMYRYKTYHMQFVIDEKPIALQRPRAGRGHHFYNPSAADENRYKKMFKSQCSVSDLEFLKPLMADDESQYYVDISCEFYIPICESDSISTAALKEINVIPAVTRNGDIDNYLKFILDSLHDVIYTDDKRVVSVSAKKYYSLDPKSKVNITIYSL